MTERGLAENHTGWDVQFLSDDGRGWVKFAGPYVDRTEAERVRDGWKATLTKTEFRVYEALT